MSWETERLHLVALDDKSAPDLLQYRLRNRVHLAPWEPSRPERDLNEWAVELHRRRQESEDRQGLQLGLRLKKSDELVGLIQFSNVVRGVFQACHLGFSLDHAYVGRGLMFEGLQRSVEIMFADWHLHRVMANHLPENKRSEKVLEKLGFDVEGLAKSYLKINGAWRDHVLRSKVNSASV